MNPAQKVISFVKEVKGELGKVSWSTREELVGSTAVVIVVTSLAAVFIGVLDLMLSKGLSPLFR